MRTASPTSTRLVPVVLALALLLGTLSAAVLVAPAAHAGPAAAYARQATSVTNTIRDNRDRRVLKVQRCLRRKAVAQARQMAKTETMFHQDLGPVLSDCGLDQAGENVAYGYPSGRAVVREGWMESEGHRANILRRSYRLTGIGAVQGDDDRWYVAQVFGRKA